LEANLQRTRTSRFLIFSLICISFIVLAANFLGRNIATTTTDFLYLPVSGTLLILSIIISIRFKGKSDIGRAYLFFTGFAVTWFIAELIWFISEIFYQLNPFPYVDDSLYLLGYPFLLLFSIYYLKPIGAAISKKMLAFACLATALFLVPTFYNTYSSNPHANWDQIMWAGIYPLVDAILLFPTVIGTLLFFKGNVGLLWSLMFFAILLNIIADSGFLYLDVDRTYYSGNPINLLYLWSYVLFSFGIYSHIKVFKKPKMKSFGNIDELK
jgi:hypothetical protein